MNKTDSILYLSTYKASSIPVLLSNNCPKLALSPLGGVRCLLNLKTITVFTTLVSVIEKKLLFTFFYFIKRFTVMRHIGVSFHHPQCYLFVYTFSLFRTVSIVLKKIFISKSGETLCAYHASYSRFSLTPRLFR